MGILCKLREKAFIIYYRARGFGIRINRFYFVLCMNLKIRLKYKVATPCLSQ